MPIKNYTTKVPVDRTIQEIQAALVKHGASAVLLEYKQGTGRIGALKFKLPFKGTEAAFQLPVDWRRFQQVLREQRVSRARDDNYCYRVAWRVVRDWVLAQLALHETQMVDLPQVFLPYAMTQDGNATLYDRVISGNLLGDGRSA